MITFLAQEPTETHNVFQVLAGATPVSVKEGDAEYIKDLTRTVDVAQVSTDDFLHFPIDVPEGAYEIEVKVGAVIYKGTLDQPAAV